MRRRCTWFILCFLLLALCRRGNALSSTATYNEGRLILLHRKSSTSSFSLCQQNSSTSSSQPFANHRLPDGAFLDLCLEPYTGSASGSESYAEVDVIELKRKLVGSGAHRELQTSITITLEKSEECDMVIVERLSSGVFADMFELQGLVARAVYKEAAIYGDHNLELSALHSFESMVVVHTSFKSTSGHPTQAQVSLPLHARYPTLSLDSHVVVDIKFPYLLFRCSCKDGTASASFSDSFVAPKENLSWGMLTMINGSSVNSIELKWHVPAGNPQHAGIVAALTSLFSIVGVVILWVVSMCSYESHKVKVT